MIPANFSNPFVTLAPGSRIASRMPAALGRPPTCVSSGPIAAPSLPILWQPMHPAAWMIAIGSAEPPAMPAEGVEDVEVVEVVEAGMSDALTVIVPPSDSRNAITAQICWGERGRVMSGMIGSYPWTTKARGCGSDSYRYALQCVPGSRLPQRAP